MCETHDMHSLHCTYIRDKYNIASAWNDGTEWLLYNILSYTCALCQMKDKLITDQTEHTTEFIKVT